MTSLKKLLPSLALGIAAIPAFAGDEPVLDKADIGEGAIIAAGAVVTHGTKVPAHEIWAGIPARKVKACTPGQAEEFAKHYSGYIKDWYLKEDK